MRANKETLLAYTYSGKQHSSFTGQHCCFLRSKLYVNNVSRCEQGKIDTKNNVSVTQIHHTLFWSYFTLNSLKSLKFLKSSSFSGVRPTCLSIQAFRFSISFFSSSLYPSFILRQAKTPLEKNTKTLPQNDKQIGEFTYHLLLRLVICSWNISIEFGFNISYATLQGSCFGQW